MVIQYLIKNMIYGIIFFFVLLAVVLVFFGGFIGALLAGGSPYTMALGDSADARFELPAGEHSVQGNVLMLRFTRLNHPDSENPYELRFEGTCTNSPDWESISEPETPIGIGEDIVYNAACECALGEKYELELQLLYTGEGDENKVQKWKIKSKCE